METLTPNGTPSLINCSKLVVEGEIEFAADVVIEGAVTFKNPGEGKKVVASGTYKDATIEL